MYLERPIRLLGSERLLSLWSTYSKSPILTQFKWSPIVLGAVQKNLRPLSSPRSWIPWKSTNEDEIYQVPGLVTMHIRRGDYESRRSLGHVLSYGFAVTLVSSRL